jgi:predicted nucleic acid-binding protein
MLAGPGDVQNRRAVLRALDIYAASNLDYGDALILAAMEQAGSTTLYSYDQDFDRFNNIERREP